MLLSWSCSTGRSCRSSHSITHQAAHSSVLRTTKPPSLAIEEPHNALSVLLLPFPSDPHAQSWKLLAAKPAWSEHFLSLKAKQSPRGLQPVAAFVVRKAQRVRNH